MAVVLLALASCATVGAPEGPTVLRHSFDGESCRVEGPGEFEAGAVVVEFINNGTARAAVDLDFHTGDQTVEDARARIEAGATSRPYWAEPAIPYEYIDAGDRYRWEGELAAGTYHSVIVEQRDGYTIHFCSGFELAEAPE